MSVTLGEQNNGIVFGVALFNNLFRMKNKGTFFGFNLLEILVVLAIVGILGAISYPVYESHLVKTRRVKAESELIYFAAQLEHYYTYNHTYNGFSLEKFVTSVNSKFYRYKIVAADTKYFLLQADPRETQKDPGCGSLRLSSLGEKSITGNGKLTDCWIF